MPRARSVSMKDVLTFLILISLIENHHVITAYFINCENLTPLTYCPPFDSSQWKNRALCKNCNFGQKYHCCKDYDSPILNCAQDDYYCEEEIFVEGCAEEMFCRKGEEPLLNFKKDQEIVDQPEVFCRLCYNNNRYNSFLNKSSATYSECPHQKRNICTPATHKIECGKPSDETSERICRCDVRNGYYPYSHPDDHPRDGCSFTNYECRNDESKCRPDQQLLLNYTCAPVCKKGFYRPENSDECVPNPATERKQNTKTSTTPTSKTDELTSHTEKVTDSTTRLSSFTYVSTTLSPSTDDRKHTYVKVAVPCTVGSVVFISAIILCILWRKGYFRQRNDSEESGHSTQRNDSEESVCFIRGEQRPQPVPSRCQDGAPIATPDPSPGFRPRHDNHKQTDSSETDPDEETSFITPAYSTLDDEENRELVLKVLNACHDVMLEDLDPVPVLDFFTKNEIFTRPVIRDINDQITTSDRTRRLLQKVREKGIKCYRQFEKAVLESKQDNCIRELTKHESAFRDLLDKRKKSAHSGSDHSEDETTETREYTDSPRQLSKLLSSSAGFEPTGNSSDDEQNKDGNCDQYVNSINGESADYKEESYPMQDETQ